MAAWEKKKKNTRKGAENLIIFDCLIRPVAARLHHV